MTESTHAARWWRNGDHPHDRVGELLHDPVTGAPYSRQEGAVVRCFRDPDIPGESTCVCGDVMNDHGWIDVGEEGQRVCPGDLVVTEVRPAGREVYWPDGSMMGQSCTCRIREDVIVAGVLCPHHGVHKRDRERRAMELTHRMRAQFREAGAGIGMFRGAAHSATVPAEIVAAWDAELAVLVEGQVT